MMISNHLDGAHPCASLSRKRLLCLLNKHGARKCGDRSLPGNRPGSIATSVVEWIAGFMQILYESRLRFQVRFWHSTCATGVRAAIVVMRTTSGLVFWRTTCRDDNNRLSHLALSNSKTICSACVRRRTCRRSSRAGRCTRRMDQCTGEQCCTFLRWSKACSLALAGSLQLVKTLRGPSRATCMANGVIPGAQQQKGVHAAWLDLHQQGSGAIPIPRA